jgi:hypothetical protein
MAISLHPFAIYREEEFTIASLDMKRVLLRKDSLPNSLSLL